MSKVLQKTVCRVRSSDLYDRGFGEASIDFTEASKGKDNGATNPPYNSAEAFVERGTKLAAKKLALLLRLAFLEGANRGRTIFSECPPSRVWVFGERMTL